MRDNFFLNNNGVALLLVVSIISLLVAVTVQFNRDMRFQLVSSANVLSSAQMNTMVKSGVNLAQATLKKDAQENTYDSFHDGWAGLGEDTLKQFYGRGKLEVLIEDLGGRIQINSLVGQSAGEGEGEGEGGVSQQTREILLRLIEGLGSGAVDSENATQIVDAITDWIDKDDKERGIEATESSYYLTLDPPYGCKNGPIEFTEELLLIRGISRELYYGTDEFPGLQDLITVRGSDGKVNINTAPKTVLLALHEQMTDELAEKMVSFRDDKDNADLLEDVSWYTGSGQWPGDVTFDTKVVTTSSSYFRLVSRAELNDMEKVLTAVVHRKSAEKMNVIYRKVE